MVVWGKSVRSNLGYISAIRSICWGLPECFGVVGDRIFVKWLQLCPLPLNYGRKTLAFKGKFLLPSICLLKSRKAGQGGCQGFVGYLVPRSLLDRLAKFACAFLYKVHIVLNASSGVH